MVSSLQDPILDPEERVCQAFQYYKMLKEQCIHHFNLINYDYVYIMDH